MQDYPKHIPSFDRLYTVRPSGKIEIAEGRIAPPPEFSTSKEGLPVVTLGRPTHRGKYRSVKFLVKEVVARAFVPNPNPSRYKRVRVRDKDEHNLSYLNLEWIDVAEYRAERLSQASTSTSPSGWHGNTRRLPDGTLYKRDMRSVPIRRFKAVPTSRSVKPGALERIYPSLSAAAKDTGCSAGGIFHCCNYWLLEDGMGSTEIDVPGHGRCTSPEELPRQARVAASRDGRFWVFKWSGWRNRHLHPIAITTDGREVHYFESVAQAAKHIYTAYDTPEKMARELSSAAARSPMWDDPSALASLEDWPSVTTRLGRVGVFYI